VGDDQHERRVAGLVVLGPVGEGGGQRAQRLEAVGELGVGEPGECGVAEVEQGVDLAVEDGNGGDGGAGSGDGNPPGSVGAYAVRVRPSVNAR